MAGDGDQQLDLGPALAEFWRGQQRTKLEQVLREMDERGESQLVFVVQRDSFGQIHLTEPNPSSQPTDEDHFVRISLGPAGEPCPRCGGSGLK